MEYLTSPFDYWEGYPVKPLPIQSIVQICPTTTLFTQQVKKRLAQEGLALPLLCVDLALERLIELYEETDEGNMLSPESYPKNKERAVAVFGGNTRLVAAKELGYTHVDCIILNWKNDKIKGERMEYMWDLQKKQRREFPEMYPDEMKDLKNEQ